MRKVILQTPRLREDLLEDKLLSSLFFGIGRTLHELLDRRSLYSTFVAIGNNMLEYLEGRGIEFRFSADPWDAVVEVCRYYVNEGFARRIEISKRGDRMTFVVHQPFSFHALESMLRHYEVPYKPSPLVILILTALSKLAYRIRLRKSWHRKGLIGFEVKLERIDFGI